MPFMILNGMKKFIKICLGHGNLTHSFVLACHHGTSVADDVH